MSKYLIVGLGNIGAEYAGTRHNIGFDVVAAFVKKHNAEFVVDKLVYKATVKFKGKIFICICPTTFMNVSGKAFKYWMDKESVMVENTLTIVDDLALPLNKIRLRGSGSSAGHNGLKDIEIVLGNNAYPKLRFGIGNDFAKGFQANFVLSKWTKQEESMVKHKIELAVTAIESFASIGLQRTMTEVNQIIVT
jgi:peptidyl-tRNA hydrolase, PTH1 family